MRSYALHRPIGPFTWPSEHSDKVSEIVNWDHMQFVPEIKRSAFGYIEWAELPPMEDLRRYELMVPPTEDETLITIGRVLANYEARAARFEEEEAKDKAEKAWAMFEDAWQKAKSEYGYSDDEIERAWTTKSEV